MMHKLNRDVGAMSTSLALELREAFYGCKTVCSYKPPGFFGMFAGSSYKISMTRGLMKNTPDDIRVVEKFDYGISCSQRGFPPDFVAQAITFTVGNSPRPEMIAGLKEAFLPYADVQFVPESRQIVINGKKELKKPMYLVEIDMFPHNCGLTAKIVEATVWHIKHLGLEESKVN